MVVTTGVDVAGLFVEHRELGGDRAGGLHDLAHGRFHAGRSPPGRCRPACAVSSATSLTSFMVLTSSREVAEISLDVAPISAVVAAISLAVLCCSLAVAAISVAVVLTWMPDVAPGRPGRRDRRPDGLSRRSDAKFILLFNAQAFGEIARASAPTPPPTGKAAWSPRED